jgi:hypothetical protein
MTHILAAPRWLSMTAVAALLTTAPIIGATPAAADECPVGQVVDGYTGECILDISPVTYVDAPEGITIYSGPTYSGGQVPTVNGIPCTPEHYATCVGMSQNQVPHTTPRSVITHSP